MAELRPLLDEYERLLEAADTLASIEAAPADGPPPEPPPRPAPSRRRTRRPRGSAAGAIELVASPPATRGAGACTAHATDAAPAAQDAPLRTQPMLSTPVRAARARTGRGTPADHPGAGRRGVRARA